MQPEENNVNRKAQKLVNNGGSTPLATLEATMEVAEKLSEVAELLANMPKTLSMEGVERVDIKGDKGEQGDKGDSPTDDELVSLITPLIPEPIKGEQGDKGNTGDKGDKGDQGIPGIDGTNGIDGKDGNDGSPDTPIQVRDKLESLQDDNRLDASAIKGFNFPTREEITSLIARIPKGGGGSGGVEVFNSTGKVGSGSGLRFTGSGIASISNNGSVTTIDISGGGGGAGTLAEVSAGSTDATKSTYTMTSGVPVHYKYSDNTTAFYIDETNKRFGFNTSSPGAPLDVRQTLSDTAGTGSIWLGESASKYFAQRIDTSGNFNIDRFTSGSWFNALTVQRTTGYLGIGTTPTKALDVLGKAVISPGGSLKTLSSTALHVKGDTTGSSYDPGSNNVGMFFENFGSSDSFYVFQLATGYGRVFEVSNAGRAYIYGNLGVGTLTPRQSIDTPNKAIIGQTMTSSDPFFSTGNILTVSAGTNANQGINVRDYNDYTKGIIITSSNGSTALPYIGTTLNSTRRLDLGSGMAVNMTLLSGGNTGFGTTSPSDKVHIFGTKTGGTASPTTPGLTIHDTTSATQGVGGGINFTGNYTGTTSTTAGSIQAYKENSTDGNYGFAMGFHTRENGIGGWAERMRISSLGYLGIGTTSPSARIHGISTTEQLRLGYDTSNYYSTTVSSTGGVTFNAVGSGAGFTFSDDVSVPDEAYGSGWNGSLEVPTKNAVYDKIETLGSKNFAVLQSDGTVTINNSNASDTYLKSAFMTIGSDITFNGANGRITLASGKKWKVSLRPDVVGSGSSSTAVISASAIVYSGSFTSQLETAGAYLSPTYGSVEFYSPYTMYCDTTGGAVTFSVQLSNNSGATVTLMASTLVEVQEL